MIEIKNIYLQIGNQLLLDNEEMKINEGYIHVIMGESGSGKTTLLYEISLLSHISHSSYDWNNLRIDSLNDDKRAELRRNNIGYILQDLELISEDLSLKDNIDCMFSLTGQDYDEERVKEYMEKMKLHISLDQRVEEMSRGERQRFALVLALIKDVDLIICDEPTSALDKENTVELMEHLQVIARDYHKMIVIATHDSYVGDKADVLYRIENKHLIKEIRSDIKEHDHQLKKHSNIKQQFFKVYKKSHKKVSQLIMKIVYVIMILVLCIVPLILDSLLDKQKELYNTYASNEIIVVNTKERLPYSRYNQSSEIFNEDTINMLKEIEHINGLNYYWELNGILSEGDHTADVLIVPKKNIDNIVISSNLASKFKKLNIYSVLVLENKEYEIEINTDKYNIKDYPPMDNVDKEVIYMPFSMMKDILAQKGITTSSSVSVECDKIDNIEDTIAQIQRWITTSTVSSSGTKYKEQIENLQMLQQFISVLRVVMIVGIIAIAYIIQTMENKARENEISNLRINGMNKNTFYTLYYYENYVVIASTILLCFVGYIVIVMMFDLTLSFINVLMILMESIIYIILTRIIPLFISVQQIFSKDISSILRDSM